MKILQICTTDSGGAGTAALRLHLGLKSLGVQSKILVMDKQSTDEDVVRFDNTPFSYIKNKLCNRLISFELNIYKNNYAQDYDLFSDDRTIYDISKHSLIKEADIINLRWVAHMVNYTEFFPRIVNKPTVWRLSDMNPITGGCHYSNGCINYQTGCGSCPQLGSKNTNDLSRRILKRKQKAYRKHSYHIVAPSNWLKDCIQKSLLFEGCDVDVIPNGVPTDIFRRRNRPFSRDLLNLPQDKTLILFGACYLTERKGFKYLLGALKLLKKKIDTSRIAVVTFGPQQEITAFHKDTKVPVYQLGYICIEKLLSHVYSSADMSVAPSTEDSSPNIVLESMACEIPVIGFDGASGLKDIVISNKTGLLAELKSTKNLADKIEYMVTHPEEREAMGENARKTVEQSYTLETQARSYRALYEAMLKK